MSDPGPDTDTGNGTGAGLDPEEARYAPRPPRRFIWARRVAAVALVVVLVAIVAIAGYKWTQNQYYVANHEDSVAIFRGIEADLPGVRLHRVEETSELLLDRLPTYNARQVRDGISANGLEDARGIISRLERLELCPEVTKPAPSASPSAGQQPSATPSPSSSPSASPALVPCTEVP